MRKTMIAPKSDFWGTLPLVLVALLLSMQKTTEGYVIGKSTRLSQSCSTMFNLGMKNHQREAVFSMSHSNREENDATDESKRKMMKSTSSILASMMVVGGNSMTSTVSRAADEKDAFEVTSKVFVDLKGLSPAGTDRIVVGLFGKVAPNSVSIIQSLCSTAGWETPCRPREERMLQKDQLEANKVYNSCVESEDKGVTYDFSTVWRIIPNQQIDLGAVTGKYLSRVPPNFDDKQTVPSSNINTAGLVTVRRGNEGGFGFSITPVQGVTDMEWENRILVGRVLEGMDVINQLNTAVPIVQRSSSSSTLRTAPSRACRYGSTEFYCNDYKPLKKILVTQTGVLSS